MTVKVVDASIAAALIFVEQNADEAAALLDGARLIAPSILTYEIANVSVTKARQEPESETAIRIGLSRLSHLAIELLPIDIDAVASLAIETGLSAYDASYLWLSRTQNAELATFDKRLMRAAAR